MNKMNKNRLCKTELNVKREIYVSNSFQKNWEYFLDKFGKKGNDAKDNIDTYYHNSVELIRQGKIGKSDSLEIKSLKFVPKKGNGKFFECKQHRVLGTCFCPRILFVNVRGTNHSILLDVIDKDSDRIGTDILSVLSLKYRIAIKNNYANTYLNI